MFTSCTIFIHTASCIFRPILYLQKAAPQNLEAVPNSKSSGTPGKLICAECHRLCRVPEHGHSAKCLFAECRPSANKGHSASFIFAECRWAHTRQRGHTCPARAPAVRHPSGGLTASTLYRVPPVGTRQSRNVAECAGVALGKASFAE